MTDTEYRTEFAMWCIMGSSLIVATDIRNMTDIMKEVRMICRYVIMYAVQKYYTAMFYRYC